MNRMYPAAACEEAVIRHIACDGYVNYTTFFSKNNPFLKFLDFCIFYQSVAWKDLIFVKKDQPSNCREENGFYLRKIGKIIPAENLYIIKMENKTVK